MNPKVNQIKIGNVIYDIESTSQTNPVTIYKDYHSLEELEKATLNKAQNGDIGIVTTNQGIIMTTTYIFYKDKIVSQWLKADNGIKNIKIKDQVLPRDKDDTITIPLANNSNCGVVQGTTLASFTDGELTNVNISLLSQEQEQTLFLECGKAHTKTEGK